MSKLWKANRRMMDGWTDDGQQVMALADLEQGSR